MSTSTGSSNQELLRITTDSSIPQGRLYTFTQDTWTEINSKKSHPAPLVGQVWRYPYGSDLYQLIYWDEKVIHLLRLSDGIFCRVLDKIETLTSTWQLMQPDDNDPIGYVTWGGWSDDTTHDTSVYHECYEHIINVGFYTQKYVCKICDRELTDEEVFTT